MPLHQQILGKGQIELDTIEDLRYRLEQYNDNDAIEPEDYLACHEALDIREAKARETLSKARGRYVKPDTKVVIKARHAPHKPLKRWQVKLIWVVVILVFWKILSFKA